MNEKEFERGLKRVKSITNFKIIGSEEIKKESKTSIIINGEDVTKNVFAVFVLNKDRNRITYTKASAKCLEFGHDTYDTLTLGRHLIACKVASLINEENPDAEDDDELEDDARVFVKANVLKIDNSDGTRCIVKFEDERLGKYNNTYVKMYANGNEGMLKIDHAGIDYIQKEISEIDCSDYNKEGQRLIADNWGDEPEDEEEDDEDESYN